MIDTKALREKILDLAIRGKLVPQDPKDEPASVLLERIRVQKQQMVKEGKLKAKDIKNDTIIFKGEDNLHYEQFQDGTVKCIEDEIPFGIPDSWEWCRIQSIASVRGGKRIPKGYSVTDEKTAHAYIRVTDMKNNTVNLNDLKYISDEVYSKISSYTISKNDLYVTIAGTIGNVGEIPDELDGMNLTENAVKICNISINKAFLCKILSSELVQKQFRFQTHQVTMAKLALERILDTLIPLPPFNEQERIIASINKILRLIDKIECSKDSLVAEVDKFKSKILDLAIRGKLVPQDPNDEPASVLLERIKAEKEELIKQGKIKRDKKESVIFKGEDNSYYQDLPENWELVAFSDIATLISGRDLKSTEYNSDMTGIPYITGASNFNKGKVLINRWTTSPKSISIKNDILLTCKGTVGELAINNHDKIHIARQIMAIRIFANINLQYIKLFFESKILEIKKSADGLIPGISRDDILSLNIPLPPLAEQCRIVQAIKSSFAQLDEITNPIS